MPQLEAIEGIVSFTIDFVVCKERQIVGGFERMDVVCWS